MDERAGRISKAAALCAALARYSGLRIAVAESLTAGRIASALGAAPEASEWFLGGVVAYHPEAKFRLLGIESGPFITATCAERMAINLRHRSGADVTVAVTGVGGPGAKEGCKAGTVFISTSTASKTNSHLHHVAGDPSIVVDMTTLRALEHLAHRMESSR